jgi:diguanylate cyclase (GGDEF)-like protein/PAS domain S-box-containing protein
MNVRSLPPDPALRAKLDGVLVVDTRGAIRYCSAELAGRFGQPAAGLLGRPARSLLPGLPPHPRTLIGNHPRLLQFALADGTSVPVEIVCEALQVANEALIAVEVRVPRDGQADESMRKFAWAAEQSPDAIMITDAAGAIEYVNAAFEAMTGFARVEVLGRTPAVLRSGVQDAAFYRGLWATINGGRAFHGILVNRKRSGETYHEEETIRPLMDRKGRITHFICAGRDVSERVREVEKLTHAATHDSLTDLPSRNLFLDRLGQALRNAKRREEGFALAVVDLDRFKEVNDRFGHLAGDALLRAVALRLQRCVRESDTVARLSGDEFALILVGAGERAAVSRILDKVLSAASVPVRFEHHALHVGLSVGVCIYPRDGKSGEELHKRADAAMYAAKRAGGNRCHYFRSRNLSAAGVQGASHVAPAGHARRAVAAKPSAS